MTASHRKRLVLSPWKILLMHAPFRVYRHGGPGFAPGIRHCAVHAWHNLLHWIVDHDRIKYLVMRLRTLRR